VIHGNALEHIPASYTRFLERYFLEAFKLQGTPLRIQYKTSKNPFAVEGRPAKAKLRREK
jgi:GTP-binding protein